MQGVVQFEAEADLAQIGFVYDGPRNKLKDSLDSDRPKEVLCQKRTGKYTTRKKAVLYFKMYFYVFILDFFKRYR